jgi:predicted RNase H-like HicB family nuclease
MARLRSILKDHAAIRIVEQTHSVKILLNISTHFLKESVEPMKRRHSLTAIIEREDDLYVALCPELDIASQGDSVESARLNLVEALELFFETADPEEIKERLRDEVFI